MYKPYGFIYITTNQINRKRYIGQCAFDKKVKWQEYLGSGVYLLKDIKKYGREKFSREMICTTFSRVGSNILERHFIVEYDAVKSKMFYNIALGGQVTLGFKGKKHTSASRNKIRKHMLSNHPNKGKHWSDTIRKNMSNAKIGKSHHTAEQLKIVQQTGLQNAHVFEVLCPDGQLQIVTNLRFFTKEHNIKYNSLYAAYRKNKPHKGFKIIHDRENN